jgi:hypothetical protein
MLLDKTNSAELTEAINSMFTWYRAAEVCYAYLADLDVASPNTSEHSISRCRWFTTGCLQELIAPRELYFYDWNWVFVGTKKGPRDFLTQVTKVDKRILEDSNLLHSETVGRLIYWAANRGTTRIEDAAYCLLGIFDINMPMLYGEGHNAFRRLPYSLGRNAQLVSHTGTNGFRRIYDDPSGIISQELQHICRSKNSSSGTCSVRYRKKKKKAMR